MPRPFGRLLVRRDFLRLAAGRRKWVAPGLILQVLPSEPHGATFGVESRGRRVGYTASKKVGNAVCRNRAKRRLREVARHVMASHAAPDHDYVIIARMETVSRPYGKLVADLEAGLRRLKVWVDAERSEDGSAVGRADLALSDVSVPAAGTELPV
jgi:ribonuclease P protein component